MKDYKEVVTERFNKENSYGNNIYSIYHPIGLTAKHNIETLLCNIFKQYIVIDHDIDKLKILDIGCGQGGITRFYLELLQNPQNIFGMDLSELRIKMAKKVNPAINYYNEDVVYISPDRHATIFDVISAFDVLSHLNTKDQIEYTLKNIYQCLNRQGIFIWYDIYAKDHFVSPRDADSWGFNEKQMEELASSVGFKLLKSYTKYKMILGKYHSLYLLKYFPQWFVKIIESCYLGKPGNVIHIYKKI